MLRTYNPSNKVTWDESIYGNYWWQWGNEFYTSLAHIFPTFIFSRKIISSRKHKYSEKINYSIKQLIITRTKKEHEKNSKVTKKAYKHINYFERIPRINKYRATMIDKPIIPRLWRC